LTFLCPRLNSPAVKLNPLTAKQSLVVKGTPRRAAFSKGRQDQHIARQVCQQLLLQEELPQT